MVDKLQTENSTNSHMHYGQPYTIGVLNPPDRLPRVTVYSFKEGEKQYRQMEYDIYQGSKKAKAPEKHKFPKVLKILGGIVIAAGAFIFRKNILNSIKGLFKKSPTTNP
ncbi:hypothetical protein HDR58_03965 [bacterium]|nr:hypothetical protein [bacterium]